jgi:LmbE family N-acetylglucosaminyl deacetylase
LEYKYVIYPFDLIITNLRTVNDVFMNILALGAHPDDIELGCGGLMLKASRAGHNIFMYTLTRGEASGDPVQRVHEMTQSAKYIRAKALWIDKFQDTRLTVDTELINNIEAVINKAQADLVITHSLNDTHHDHRAVASSTIEAGRFAKNIIGYENPLTKEFKPQSFYDISEVIDEKISLIELFKTQRDKIYLHANAIRGLAAYRALQSRLNSSNQTDLIYVEAFEVMKMCIDNGFKLTHMDPLQVPCYLPKRLPPKEILELAVGIDT